MQPSDFLPTFGLGSGSPCLRPTSSTDASSSPENASTRCRAPVGDWSPALRTTGICPRSVQDLPVYRTVPSVRATVNHPARCTLPSPTIGKITAAFRNPNTLGTWKIRSFVAVSLRLARPKTYASLFRLPATAQGLSSDLPGSALVGWGSHPLDSAPNFKKVSPPPFPLVQH
jgi:hypothetical protein